MRAVHWADEALDQFDAAVAWLAERNPGAALRLADAIEATVANLAIQPIGRPGERDGTYEMRVKDFPYILIYQLGGAEDATLYVLRIYHTSQDWTGWAPGPMELDQ